MGLWAAMKRWFNIGGVKVLLWKYSEPLSLSSPVITGAVLFKTKSDKTINGLEVKVIEEHTKTVGEGEEKRKETETDVLGSIKFPEYDSGVGYPFDLKAGDQKEQTFSFSVIPNDRLQNSGGVLGGLGKLAAFASGEKLEYFIVAEARVKGAAFVTTDKQKLKVAK